MKITIYLTITLCALGVLTEQVAFAKGSPAAAPPGVSNAQPGVVAVGEMSYEEKKLRALDSSPIRGLEFYPRVSGSTSTIPIGQLLAAHALGLKAELRRTVAAAAPTSFFFGGVQSSSLALTFARDADVALLQEYSALWGRNPHLQTSQSYLALVSGAADLSLVAREPSSDELEAARKAGIEFDVRPVALDALVFLVNQKNPAQELSVEQIRKIYSGEIKDWGFSGNAATPIVAVTRDRNSGSEELMRKLVMGELPSVPGRDREEMTMIGTLDRVARDPNALAYSVFYYERMMNPRAEIKTLAVNGVLPDAQTIGNKTYPLVEPVYVVTRKKLKADDPAAILRDWLLSPEGQRLIAQTGYVPLSR